MAATKMKMAKKFFFHIQTHVRTVTCLQNLLHTSDSLVCAGKSLYSIFPLILCMLMQELAAE